MKRLVFTIFLSLTTLNITSAEDLTIKPTTIAGFINSGNASEGGYNIVIIKSLLSSFSQLPDTKVTSYEEVSKKAKDYWANKKMDLDQALHIAQYFDSKQMITGDYTVSKERDKITINVYVYDVVTGELKLKRTYDSKGSTGIFNAIDNMAKNLSGLLSGQALDTGLIMINFHGLQKPYDLYINSKFAGKITNQLSFQSRQYINRDIEISIRHSESGKESLRRQLTVKKDETNTIEFFPGGNIILKNMIGTAQASLDGVNLGEFQKDQDLLLSIMANTNHSFSLGSSLSTNIFLMEGEEKIIVLLPQDFNAANYRGKQPLWDIVIPGLVQFQANDPWMGTLFLCGGLAGMGMTGLSVYGLSLAVDLQNRNTNPDNNNKYNRWTGEWTWILAGSAVLWAASAGLSTLHAYSMSQSSSAARDPFEFSFFCGIDSAEFQMNFHF